MYSNVCDIVAVGECAVGGKTSLINRFVENKFVDIQIAIIGWDLKSKVLYINEINKDIRLDICDTSGHEMYRWLTAIFIKDANAIILAYDIIRRDTFTKIKSIWYSHVKKNCVKDPSKIL